MKPAVAKARDLIAYVAIIAMLGVAILYANHTQTQTEQKFCTVINLIVDAYHRNTQPLSPLGAQLGRDYLALQHDLGCVPNK